ncbi:sialate O-acetylesterase [Chitinophaga oryzae]|uniref:Sialate O-acetylesterase n=1 Tax=Chitinophaga oryzae TaxID=2725414 RepID=A0AAE7D7S0_9BACT|nr:sialate O-acetylesterase [Chitinophaga oryzae]QJB32551.1 sialate O-acetylesterase [Chitinophaga oryzae]QJB39026.1 sialate O-acetylesterase [Chitinophaga oryzae]
MIKKHLFYGFLLFLLLPTVLHAAIRLPSLVGSNMVLQQNDSVTIWGWANPAEKITVYTGWDNKTLTTTTGGDAKWALKVQTPAAGGPYEIKLKGANEIVLKNILIGEVWLCSGQSNMEFSYYNGVRQIAAELPVCSNPNIRFFNIPKTTATSPQDDCPGTWEVCDSNSLKPFSAVGYFFGKKLQQSLGVPVGLINASWGGTPAEVWAPEHLVTDQPQLSAAAAKLSPAAWWPHQPGYAYNAMIAPLHHYNIKGVIWYQGEANVKTAATYAPLFTGMIQSWREAWHKPIPFYYVQIAPFTYDKENEAALLREAQAHSNVLAGTGMVVVYDVTDNVKDIHPQDKKTVGDRLANWALGENYGKNGFTWKSPAFKEISISKNKAMVRFSSVPTALRINGKTPAALYIAGADKVFYEASAKVEKDVLVVWSSKVEKPESVRYGFSNTAIGNIFSSEGLPVAPFRTDNWPVTQ